MDLPEPSHPLHLLSINPRSVKPWSTACPATVDGLMGFTGTTWRPHHICTNVNNVGREGCSDGVPELLIEGCRRILSPFPALPLLMLSEILGL